MKIIQNTKDNPIMIQSLEDYKTIHAIWYSFVCQKCGRVIIKRDQSIRNMIFNENPLYCGPCLRQKTCLERYGDPTYNNARWGSRNPSSRPEVREKISRANKRNLSGIEKRRQTCLKKYGVDNPAKSKEIQQKIESTCLQRYGVKAPAQNPEIFKKCFKNIEYDNEYFDSSWELAFWIWNKTHNIDIQRNHKGFKLSNGSYCYPDFIINDQLIEIKGDHLKKRLDYKYKQEFYEQNNVKVYSYEELLPYFKEVYEIMKEQNLPIPRIKF
jgi:predicted RNA-binding Zn-ribbon protein involved in translation (DUF1610 family)